MPVSILNLIRISRAFIQTAVSLLMMGPVAVLVAGCLDGGGASTSSSPTSAGAASFVSSTILDYDTVSAKLNLKGDLTIPGGTGFNIIKFYSNSTCTSAVLGQGLKQDFSSTGIAIQLASTAVTSIYVSTNTVADCFYLFDFLPRYDAPPVPTLSSTSPASPSRTTTDPYVVGTTSMATKTVRLYSDAACTLLTASGSASDFKTTGLHAALGADTSNRIFATAADAFGKTSPCTQIGSYQHSSTGPSVPTFVTMDPVSPTNQSLTPKLIGAVGLDADSVAVFSDAACTTMISSGPAADFRTTGFQLTANDNASTTFYGRSTDSTGLQSDCAFLTIYVHDSLPPAAPTFISVNPASPTRLTLYPRVKGTAPADALLVKLFDNSTCTTLTGSGSKSVFEGAGIPATVRANDVTTVYAASVDAAGNMSPCTTLISYVHDTIAPDAPSFTGTTPASPNNRSVTPLVLGNLDPTAQQVRLFDDDLCTHSIGTGTAADFSSTGIRVSVTGNRTTTIYSRALDEAQNASDCTALTNYAHSTVPAPNPGFYQSVPPSPSRVTNRPSIVGTASNIISKVTIYRDVGCTNPVGTANRSTFTTSGIQVTVPLNAKTDLYGMSEDVYGNSSSCAVLTSFTHDTVAPRDPIYTSLTPTSPNNSSTTPRIYGSLVIDAAKVLPVTSVALYDSFLCLNRIGTGTLATGVTATVAPNSLTTVYARAFDDAGNSSGCVYFADYVHDSLVPGRPQLLSITPSTPSYSALTKVYGRILTTTDFLTPTAINVYSDASCSNIMTSGAPSTFTTTGIPLVVNRNATTTVFATTVNAVGTSSACTPLINYAHSDVGPGGVTAVQNLDGSISVGWLSDTVASPMPTYIVRRSIVSGGPYTTVAPLVNGTAYIDFSISNGSTYYYSVAAMNVTGVSKNSAEVAITVNVPTPNAVAGLSALPGPNQVTLNWNGFNTDMTFKVYRATQTGGPYTVVATKLASSTYIDLGLTNATPYFYVVLGTNPTGDSLQSNEASAMPVDIPAAPTGLTLKTVLSTPNCSGGPGVVLSWSPSPYFNTFKIYRGQNSGASGLLATAGSTSFTDCSPSVYYGNPPINYNYYAITAGWGTLESAQSNTAVFANEAAPTLKVYPGNNLVRLIWTADPSATAYQIQRSTSAGGPYSILAASNSSSTYDDTAVTNGQSYFYVVTALYPASAALGWQSLEQSGIPGVNPGAPLDLLLTITSNKMPLLTWVPTDAYNYFNVYRAPTAGGTYTYIGNANTPNFTDASPDPGTNFYKVTAVWGGYESAATNVVSFRSGTPLTLTATAGTSTVTVGWSAVTGVLNYEVFRATQTGGPYTSRGTTTSLTYLDSAVNATTGYFYVVRANFADGTSGQFTDEANAILTSTTVPAGLSIINTTSSSLTVNWAKVSGATSYKVYRATTVGGTYTLVATVTTTSAIVSPLNPDTLYFVKVQSVKSGAASGYSAVISGYTLDIPSAPSTTAGVNSISLNWGDVGANTYDIKRSTDGITFASLATGLTSTTYIDSSVSTGNQYFYTVVANYTHGSLESPASLGATPGILARVPQGLTVTDNSSGSDIQLAWASVSGTTAYKVYSSTTNGGPYSVALQTSSTSNNLVTGLNSGTTYYFVVTSLVGTVESAFSSQIAVIPKSTPPSPTATASGLTIALSWTSVSGASSYDVYRSSDSVTYSLLANNGASTTYVDSSVAAANGYFYKYLPKNSSGVFMAPSYPSIQITPLISASPPQQLVASASGTTSATLTWVQVPNATGYVLYRGTASGGPYTNVTTVSSPTTTYMNSGLTPGQTYYYVVRSTNISSVESANSNEAAVNLVSPPASLSANSVANAINLSWSAVSGASSYNVRRSQNSSGPYGRIAAGINGTTYVDSNIQNGVTYYYVVSATVTGNTSTDSNQASAIGTSAMNLEFAVELTDQGLGSDVGAVIFDRTRTTLNTGDYDGTVTYSFEVVATNSDSVPRAVMLVDAAASTVATVTVPASTVSPTRIRVSAAPTTGAQTYRIKTAATTASASVQVYSSRLVVKQVAATKTKLYIPLMASAGGIYTGDAGAYIEATSNLVYNELGTAAVYRRNTSQLATIANQNAWEFEAVVGVGGNARGAVALYNTTRGDIVDDTESVFDSAGPTLVRSPFAEGAYRFDAANEGDLYQVVLRCDTSADSDCDTGSARLYKAGLWVTLSSLDKIEVIYRLGYSMATNSEALPTTERTRINLANFTNPTTYFQATGQVTAQMDSANVELLTLGTTDSGTLGASAIAGSSLLFNATNKTYQRTPATITVNSGDRFIPHLTPGTGLFRFYDASLVIRAHR